MKHLARLLIMAVTLQVTEPVCVLQVDVDTTDTTKVDDLLANKQVKFNRLNAQTIRIVVSDLNQETFVGNFANIDGTLTGVHGVVAGDKDGNAIPSATVKWISAPKKPKVVVKP